MLSSCTGLLGHWEVWIKEMENTQWDEEAIVHNPM